MFVLKARIDYTTDEGEKHAVSFQFGDQEDRRYVITNAKVWDKSLFTIGFIDFDGHSHPRQSTSSWQLLYEEFKSGFPYEYRNTYHHQTISSSEWRDDFEDLVQNPLIVFSEMVLS